MKYCTHCGNELLDEAVVCPKCGCAAAAKPTEPDIPSTGLNVLSFLIPLVGLICFAAMYSTSPKKAKAAGRAALISVILAMILYFILGVIVAVSGY